MTKNLQNSQVKTFRHKSQIHVSTKLKHWIRWDSTRLTHIRGRSKIMNYLKRKINLLGLPTYYSKQILISIFGFGYTNPILSFHSFYFISFIISQALTSFLTKSTAIIFGLAPPLAFNLQHINPSKWWNHWPLLLWSNHFSQLSLVILY